MKFIKLTVTNDEMGSLNIWVNPDHVKVCYEYENQTYFEIGSYSHKINESLDWLITELEDK